MKDAMATATRRTAAEKSKPAKKPARPARAAAQPSAQRRTRLAPEERSDLIVQGAIRFFAERGFGGQTRELAQQLGITQGLLYRYFPTKDLLIERIYEELFVKRIKPEWEVRLLDRSEPLLPRLIRFYLDYATVLHDYEWGRIYLYSGLGGATIAKRFVHQVTQGLFKRVIAELRHAFQLPDFAAAPMTEPETELMWSLHGSIFYIGIRVSVYEAAPPSDVPATVRRLVEGFYDNARAIMCPPGSSHGARNSAAS